MPEERYWTRLLRRRLRRRDAVRYAGVGGAGFAAAACARGTSKTRSSAPSGGPDTATPKPGGTFTTFLGSNITSLDPHLVSASATIASGAFSRPFRYRSGPDPKVIEDHTTEPDAALSAESPDAITWTLKLRPGVSFQNLPPVNGHPLEAEDVKATFTRALGTPQNPNRGALGMIDPGQISTPSSDTVVFRLKYPYASFVRTLASPDYSWIMPREALAGAYDPTKQVIGSGPFILDSYTPDVGASFRRNPDWFQRGQPYIEGLKVAVVPDASQQIAQFSSGNLDELRPARPDLDTIKRNNPKVLVLDVPGATTQPIFFQLGDPSSVFLDIRVRRAVSMAIDRGSFARTFNAADDDGTIFVTAFLGKWALHVNELDPETRRYYQYNPSEAKKLVEETGVSQMQFKFPIIVNTPYASQSAPAQAINSMINAVGFKTTVVEKDFNKDYIGGGKGIRQGFFDKDFIVFSGQAPYNDVDEILFNYFHSKATSNQEHLHDDQMDAMIDKARTILNEDERVGAYKDIQKYAAAKLYVVSTAARPAPIMIQPRVANYCLGLLNGELTDSCAKLWINQ